jgi:hypothetical protein
MQYVIGINIRWTHYDRWSAVTDSYSSSTSINNIMALLDKGQATGPTSRHMNIRYFWLTDRIAAGEVQVRYMQTEEMSADALTKPLQGHLFYKHRTTLLNTTATA